MSQVGPEDAISNLAKWWRITGWPVPDWIATPNVDRYAFWVGLVMLCTWAAWYAWRRLRPYADRHPWWPTALRGRADKVDSIPIAISRVQQKHFSNYAGFTDKQAADAQVLSFGEVTITNTSPTQKVALDLFLQVTARNSTKNKTNFRVPANLRGPWAMTYGKDDIATKALSNAGRVLSTYFINPIELGPNQLSRSELVFIFWSGMRDAILNIIAKEQDYYFHLEVNDLISGRSVKIRIPGEYRGDP